MLQPQILSVNHILKSALAHRRLSPVVLCYFEHNFVGAIIDRPPSAVIIRTFLAVNDRPYILKGNILGKTRASPADCCLLATR